MSRTARVAWIIGGGVVLVTAVGLWLLATQGGSSVLSSVDLTGDGPPWTNERTGETAGPGWVGSRIPFENSDGCGSDLYTSSISYRHGWYVQAWDGPRSSVSGKYLPKTTLPETAVFTGWGRPDERLWVDPKTQTRPGAWDFLYVERGDHVERWPQATFGCM
jgi:hypothetical protein